MQRGLKVLEGLVLRKAKTGRGDERGTIIDRDCSYLPPAPLCSVPVRPAPVRSVPVRSAPVRSVA